MENLLKLLVSEAEQEKKRILEEAESYRLGLIKKAQEEATSLREQAEREIQLKARSEIERAKSALVLKEQAEILKTKSQWLDKVFQEARNRLSLFRNDPNYPAILEHLLSEVLKENEELVLTLNPKDVEIAERVKAKTGTDFSIFSDEAVDPGVLASTADGRIKIFNTLSDRLERAWPHLVVEVARILWEES